MSTVLGVRRGRSSVPLVNNNIRSVRRAWAGKAKSYSSVRAPRDAPSRWPSRVPSGVRSGGAGDNALVMLSTDLPVLSDATGLVSQVFGLSSVNTAADFGNWANIYDGFILYKMRVDLIPTNPYGNAGAQPRIYSIIDYDSTATIAIGTATTYTTAIMFPYPCAPRMKHTRVMRIPPDRRPIVNPKSGFSSNNANGAIVLSGAGFTPSITLFTARVVYYCKWVMTS